jgi:putative SOS response-associated peptidase YedK
MCGRIALYTPPAAMARLLEAGLAEDVDPTGHPSWNVGPTRRIDGVAEVEGARVLDRYRWGLIPSWAKDASFGARTFNARSETAATKPSFRAAWKVRRLLIPIDGFYEWDRRGPGKPAPHYFTRADERPLVVAGLFESWHDPAAPEDAPAVRSATVLTTQAGEDMDGIHDRMPVVLEQGAFDLWLETEGGELAALGDLCRPAPRGTLVHHRVDPAVGSVRNDGPELIAPTAPETLF